VAAVEATLSRVEEASSDRERIDLMKSMRPKQDETLELLHRLNAVTVDEPLCGALAERFQALHARDAKNVQRLEAIVRRATEALGKAQDRYRAELANAGNRLDGAADSAK
jgi:hypothetical protein